MSMPSNSNEQHNDTHPRIFAIADRIADRGDHPTLAALRAELGGGSYRDLGPALRAWKTTRAQREQQAVAPPSDVAERGQVLLAELWGLARRKADEQFAGERSAHQQAQTELEAERDEAAGIADRLSADLETTRQQLTDATTALASAEQEHAATRARAAAVGEQLTETRSLLEEARGAVAEARGAAARLNGELDAVRRQNESLLSLLGSEGRGVPAVRD